MKVTRRGDRQRATGKRGLSIVRQLVIQIGGGERNGTRSVFLGTVRHTHGARLRTTREARDTFAPPERSAREGSLPPSSGARATRGRVFVSHLAESTSPAEHRHERGPPTFVVRGRASERRVRRAAREPERERPRAAAHERGASNSRDVRERSRPARLVSSPLLSPRRHPTPLRRSRHETHARAAPAPSHRRSRANPSERSRTCPDSRNPARRRESDVSRTTSPPRRLHPPA